MLQPSTCHVQVYIDPSQTDYVFVTRAHADQIQAAHGEERVKLLTSLAYHILALYEAKTSERLCCLGGSSVTSHYKF